MNSAAVDAADVAGSTQDNLAVVVTLPTLHADQIRAYKLPGRLKAIRCGRRWGKSALGVTLACDDVLKGRYVGFFAPDYKRLIEVYQEIYTTLAPVVASSSKVDGVIRASTGGRIDFWTLEDDSAGRSRKYHRVIVDEAAFAKPNMMEIWERSIKPTLLDYNGRALVMSNTNGDDPDNFFWKICNEPRHGFVEHHAPTMANPLIPMRVAGESAAAYLQRRNEVLEALKRDNPPLVYSQEFLAEFVDWSGAAFFAAEKFLIEGRPAELPRTCASVFAIIDSATKTGREHDGTGVVFYAFENLQTAHPLLIVDWDYVQIEGDLLIAWLPWVYERLEELAVSCGARMGSIGAYIEDKASGMILLQQAQRRGWAAAPIDSKLTSVGKDERGISISGYVHREMVKMCREAYEKTVVYKGVTRNHLLTQVVGFKIGDKTPNRADDLLDCVCYGVALALGNAEGF